MITSSALPQSLDRPSTLVLPPTNGKVKIARDFVAQWFVYHSFAPDVIETARLVASELVTNAAVHAPCTRDIVVRVYQAERGAVIEVWDDSDALPAPGDLDNLHAVDGRGLAILDLLVASWGVNPLAGGGKAVFAVLAAAP